MEVVIVSSSKLRSPDLIDYSKRINKRLKFSVLENNPEKLIRDSDYIVVLDERGQKFDNLAFAKKFEQVMSSGGYRRVVFVVGDAYGVCDEIKKRADLMWSFSDQVFPHRLFGMMLAEQIYRTLEIINSSPYHHK